MGRRLQEWRWIVALCQDLPKATTVYAYLRHGIAGVACHRAECAENVKLLDIYTVGKNFTKHQGGIEGHHGYEHLPLYGSGT
jgi:hypothetical protein